MKKSEIAKFLILRTIGNFLVLIMIAGFLATLGPAMFYEANYRIEKIQGITYEVINAEDATQIKTILGLNQNKNYAIETSASSAAEQYPSLFVSADNPTERIMIPKTTEFSLIIPKIAVNEKVFANVNPNNSKEYLDVLKKGIAHAKGTALPGEEGTVYIFAHSADNFWNVGRYNAVFYLLNKLNTGDEIVIFYRDIRFEYNVRESIIVNANEVKYMNANYGKGEKLILQTCWPPGTTWKRLLIIAELKQT